MVNTAHDDQNKTRPSKEFFNALKDLKKFDERMNCTFEEGQLELKKLQNVYDLGRKEHLPFDFIQGKIDEKDIVETNCKGCGRLITIIKHRDDGFCTICTYNKEKLEWEKYCEEKKKNEHIIERYCYDIRGETPDYEMTFEESEKKAGESWEYRQDLLEKERDPEWEYRSGDKREGLTKSQSEKQKKRKRLLAREQRKEHKANWDLKMNSPVHMLSKMIDKIDCRCEAEEMRAGKFCDTCRLIVKVHEYTLDLFKRTSQGRTSDN